jgi:hypothetical protein
VYLSSAWQEEPTHLSTIIHTPRKVGPEGLTVDEQEVVAAHIPLVKKLTRKYDGYGFPDLFERLSLISCRAVLAWDSRRCTFGAYLKAAIRNRILNMGRQRI